MPKNGLVITFLRKLPVGCKLTPVSSTGISFLTTRHMIRSALGEHYDYIQSRQQADGLADKADGDSLLAPLSPLAPVDAEAERRRKLAEELSSLGKPKPRTMFTKGKGLEGEVEEQQEMVDPYMRSGIPRREI